jgi:two-component system, chemotaxis family, sensor kinase CheA
VALTGHEERFRRLYADEAEQRLTRMTEGLLALESGLDAATLDDLFREAHTLKGGAGIVGFADVARAVHAMESTLELVRDGARELSSDLIDTLLANLDTLSVLIADSLAGNDVAAQADAMRDELDRAARRQPAQTQVSEPEPVAEPVPETAVAPEAAVTRPADRTDSVRVALSRLDALSRLVSETAAAHLAVGRVLSRHAGADAEGVEEFRKLSLLVAELQQQTMQARMVPMSELVAPLQLAVRNAARTLGRTVEWEVRGEDTELDRAVLDRLADPLMHLVRNAVAHGIESPAERVAAGKRPAGVVRVHAMQLGSEVVVAVSDDGRGIDVHAVRAAAARRGVAVDGVPDDDIWSLLVTPGVSTSEAVSDLAGRGVGLDVVGEALHALRGRVEVRSEPGAGAEFRIIVPVTLALSRCVLVTAGGRRYALPLHAVVRAVAVDDDLVERSVVDGRRVAWLGQRPVPVASLAAVLTGAQSGDERRIVVVSGATRPYGFAVEDVTGQRDVVVKSLPALLPRVDVVAGASVESDGSVLLVLDPAALVARALAGATELASDAPTAHPQAQASPSRVATVLVVDDAMTVRELQRSILQRAGYDVRTAGDGLEALAELAQHPADLVLTDVEMPRMNGFELVESIRARPSLAGLPVVMLTSRSSEEDRRRGLDAGADAYIIKASFDSTALLGVVEDLLDGRA